MSDRWNVELGLLGKQVEQLQAKTKSLGDGIDVVRETMLTRREWHADHDKLMARIENVEAEVTIGFRQMLARFAEVMSRLPKQED
jgi:hypothetical protein